MKHDLFKSAAIDEYLEKINALLAKLTRRQGWAFGLILQPVFQDNRGGDTIDSTTVIALA